jgi:hypothetical protein
MSPIKVFRLQSNQRGEALKDGDVESIALRGCSGFAVPDISKTTDGPHPTHGDVATLQSFAEVQ